jgi:hypothetical protein
MQRVRGGTPIFAVNVVQQRGSKLFFLRRGCRGSSGRMQRGKFADAQIFHSQRGRGKLKQKKRKWVGTDFFKATSDRKEGKWVGK